MQVVMARASGNCAFKFKYASPPQLILKGFNIFRTKEFHPHTTLSGAHLACRTIAINI